MLVFDRVDLRFFLSFFNISDDDFSMHGLIFVWSCLIIVCVDFDLGEDMVCSNEFWRFIVFLWSICSSRNFAQLIISFFSRISRNSFEFRIYRC